MESGDSVLSRVLFKYKGSRAPRAVAWPKDYQAACEQAGTLFELTPTTFHFEITDRFTGAKKLILNDIPWQELTDATKIGVREGLWNTALVEVVDSGDAVLPQVIFKFKGSRTPPPAAWPKDYQEACEQARTLFELTPIKFHFQIKDQSTGQKRLILNEVMWQTLTDAAKEGVKEGLGDCFVLEVMESSDSVLPEVLFEYKGSRAPRTFVWPKDYQAACEQAGTLFELTPTKLHLQVTHRITDAKVPVSSNVLWEKITNSAKDVVKEGLGDIVSVEVVEDSHDESSGELEI